MDSESEREKSSDPNDWSTSQDNTFNLSGDELNIDDDVGDDDDDLVSDVDDSLSETEGLLEKFRNRATKCQIIVENADECTGSGLMESFTHSRASTLECGKASTVKVLRIAGSNLNDSESNVETDSDGERCISIGSTNNGSPRVVGMCSEAIKVPKGEIDERVRLLTEQATPCVPNEMPRKPNKCPEATKVTNDEMKPLRKCWNEDIPMLSYEEPSDELHPNEGAASVALDEQSLCESVRQSIDFFYSAQDLLSFGEATVHGSELRTPDVESGYFDRSESDLSREEYEVAVLRDKNGFEQCVSEGLRLELHRFQSMIDSIEKSRTDSRELTESREHIASMLSLPTNDCWEAPIVEEDLQPPKDVFSLQDLPTPQRGYWASVFGEASQIENSVELTLDERSADIRSTIQQTKAHRALELLEDYHSRLSEPQDRALRIAIERVIRIFKSRLFQALLARDFMQCYHYQSQSIQSLVKMLTQCKDENWFLPVMYTLCLDLRILAQRCDKQTNRSRLQPSEILEKAAECLLSCFRVCASDNRSSDEDTKRHGMLNLVNQLLKVYFRINKLHLCKPLIRAIDSSAFKNVFPLAEQITYKYFVGRKAMFDSDYKSADEFLSFALKHCPKKFANNKRLILIYLVPVRMLLGYMPTKSILERYDLLVFHQLSEALKRGNAQQFDDIIQQNEPLLIKCGIYLLVEKLKFMVYRNLFKRVYLIKQTHQLDLDDFCEALRFVGESDMTIPETHCIVSNLIFEGKIKGYISYSHNKLVVSKQNPFPALTSIS